MPPRKLNPIAIKLNSLINSGRTIIVPETRVKVTKELICFLCDLKYPTFKNVFNRQKVSYATIKSLKMAGFLSSEEEQEYLEWLSKKRGVKNENIKGGTDEPEQSD